MNSGLSIKASQGLETHLKRRRGFTGSRESISKITSSGKLDIAACFVLFCWISRCLMKCYGENGEMGSEFF